MLCIEQWRRKVFKLGRGGVSGVKVFVLGTLQWTSCTKRSRDLNLLKIESMELYYYPRKQIQGGIFSKNTLFWFSKLLLSLKKMEIL